MKSKGWYVIITQKEINTIKNSTELLIYLAIKSFCANGKREFDISIRDIQARSHLAVGTISKKLPKVIKNNYIKITGAKPRRGGMVNVYKCLLAESIKRESVHNIQESVQLSASNLPQIKKVNNKEKINEYSVKKLREDDPLYLREYWVEKDQRWHVPHLKNGYRVEDLLTNEEFFGRMKK